MSEHHYTVETGNREWSVELKQRGRVIALEFWRQATEDDAPINSAAQRAHDALLARCRAQAAKLPEITDWKDAVARGREAERVCRNLIREVEKRRLEHLKAIDAPTVNEQHLVKLTKLRSAVGEAEEQLRATEAGAADLKTRAAACRKQVVRAIEETVWPQLSELQDALWTKEHEARDAVVNAMSGKGKFTVLEATSAWLTIQEVRVAAGQGDQLLAEVRDRLVRELLGDDQEQERQEALALAAG
jgi:hypothetical protein